MQTEERGGGKEAEKTGLKEGLKRTSEGETGE